MPIFDPAEIERPPMDLDGKTFIVTRGGSGLGEATARLFAETGAIRMAPK